MNITDSVEKLLLKPIKLAQDIFYEYGFNKYLGDEYIMKTSTVEEIFSYRNAPVEVNMQKLAYYTKHELIPAPKRVGIGSVLGGSVGKYKYKVALMIWYIEELKKRGIKSQDELRLHVYNYFHTEKLPPHPVHDTPFAERYVYIWRTNKRTPLLMPQFEDFNIYVTESENEFIPCKKATYYYGKKPFDYILFPIRNLTKPEELYLNLLRRDKEFIKDNGLKVYENNGIDEIIKKHCLDLSLFVKYPKYRFGETKTSYRDLLNKTYTFNNI